MVLFIITQNEIDNDIDILCKMMINIEQNKNIYDKHGNANHPNIRKSFNSYTFQQVDYDISVSVGVLLLYMPSNTNLIYSDIIFMLISKFRELDIITELKIPVSTELYKSTTYTLLSTQSSTERITSNSVYGTSYRKLINNDYDVKKCYESGSTFVWLVKTINYRSDNYLQLAELNTNIPPKSYLMRSISTIIYDYNHIFNEKHMTKQLDYPLLSQYNMFKNNQILDEAIYISDTFGLDYEIVKCYRPTISSRIFFNETDDAKISILDYNEYEIRRRDITKQWDKQLSESYNYNEQELLEKNINESGKPSFPNDVCFITGMPLYQKAYLLKVAYITNIITGEINEKTISYILVSPYVYHSVFNKKTNIYFKSYLQSKKITILEVFISNIHRSEYDAIDMIPNKLIKPLKKEIMLSISKNGVYNMTKNNCLYTVNLNKNCIYLGINNFNDTDVINYQNTNTVLFNWKLI